MATTSSATKAPKARRWRRRPNGRRQIPKEKDRIAAISNRPRPVDDAMCGPRDVFDPDPVVVIVRVTGNVVVEEVNVTVDGLKLQVL